MRLGRRPAPRRTSPTVVRTSGAKAHGIPGFAGNIAEPRWKGVKSADAHVDVPFLPAALALFNERVETIGKDDPKG